MFQVPDVGEPIGPFMYNGKVRVGIVEKHFGEPVTSVCVHLTQDGDKKHELDDGKYKSFKIAEIY